FFCFFFSSRRRHTRSYGDWSSDVCSSDLVSAADIVIPAESEVRQVARDIRLPAQLAYGSRVLDALGDVVDRQIEVAVELHRGILRNCWRHRAESRRDDKGCRVDGKYGSPLHLRSFLNHEKTYSCGTGELYFYD